MQIHTPFEDQSLADFFKRLFSYIKGGILNKLMDVHLSATLLFSWRGIALWDQAMH